MQWLKGCLPAESRKPDWASGLVACPRGAQLSAGERSRVNARQTLPYSHCRRGPPP
jgi:hypothetical protein